MHSSPLVFGAIAFASSLLPLAAQIGKCDVNPAFADPASGTAWNGWGADISNSRFQTGKAAQMTASQVPRLKLKWSFGLPGAKQVFGEPVVVGGTSILQRRYRPGLFS